MELEKITACCVCPRRCGAARGKTGDGICRSGAEIRVARAALHFWEEPPISGERGSGAVFFTGCPLRCLFCQNGEISAGENLGKAFSPEELNGLFLSLEEQGAHNINLVTPTHFAPGIRKALLLRRPEVPVVYNTSGYERVETLRTLEGLVQIYLPDFKYAESGLAGELSAAPDYPETALAAIGEMVRQTGAPVYDENGMMRSGVLIRHMILPGHTRNSIAVLRLIRENFPGIPVSLMAQYTPIKRRLLDASCVIGAELPELFRPITARELRKVQEELFSLGLDGFVQSRSAKGTEYVPDFHQFEA